MRQPRSHPDPRDAPAAQPGPADERPSKSQRKRDAQALQVLGRKLVEAPPGQVAALTLDEPLRDAIALARKIHSHGAQRRQLQLIGKLMRDADVEAIVYALDEDGAHHRSEVAQMHAAERWRERLIDDPQALASWREHHSGDVAAQVEALVAPARAEQARGQPGRHYRDLYRCLRVALEEHSGATQPNTQEP